MDIRISQRFAQIGINYTQPQMEIVSKPADMEITQTPPSLDIIIDYPQVHVDLTAARADIGYKPIVPFATEQANRGQASALESINRIAQEGDSLARSAGKGREIIGEIAWNNAFDNYEFNVDMIPHSPPGIRVSGGIDVNYNPGRVQLNIRPNTPEIQFVPGNIKIYLEQEPMIKIEAVGTYFDLVI